MRLLLEISFYLKPYIAFGRKNILIETTNRGVKSNFCVLPFSWSVVTFCNIVLCVGTLTPAGGRCAMDIG